MTGSLQIKNGKYYAVLNLKDENGKRKVKWINTNYDIKGNKRKAEQFLQRQLIKFENDETIQKDILFCDYMLMCTEGSGELARLIQNTLDPEGNRAVKKADGIYLLERISCPGVLIECGFLSNPEEEAKLRSSEYQRQLCCGIAAAAAIFAD